MGTAFSIDRPDFDRRENEFEGGGSAGPFSARVTISEKGIGGGIGLNLGPVGGFSAEVGPDSASGWDSARLRIGPFEVVTHQEGCTITQQKIIAGMVVETETWADPSCKQAEDEEEEETPPEPPPPGGWDGDITKPPPKPDDNTGLENYPPNAGGVFYFGCIYYYAWQTSAYCDPNKPARYGFTYGSVTGITVSKQPNGSYFAYYSYLRSSSASDYPKPFTFKKVNVPETDWTAASGYGSSPAIWKMTGTVKSVQAAIKSYFKTAGTYFFNDQCGLNPIDVKESQSSDLLRYKLLWTNVSPPTKPDKSPTGRPPTLPPKKVNNCDCKAIEARLKMIMDAIGAEALLKQKFSIPNRLMLAGSRGYTKAENYLEIVENLIRILAHGLIIEPTSKIKDASALEAGNQELTLRYYNATGWAQAISEMLVEVMDDGNSNQNMNVRTGIHSTQLMVATADISQKLDAILDALGTVFQPKVETISTAYNLALDVPDPNAKKDNKGKGFDPKKQDNNKSTSQRNKEKNRQQQLDKNTDAAIEALLPGFLQGRDNPVRTVQFDADAETLYQVMREVRDLLRATRGTDGST